MKRSSLMTRVLAGLAMLGFALATNAFGQGITTSAITGFVTDKQGHALSGVAVAVVHEPTGTRSTTITRSNGEYDLSNLRPGGPYTVTVSPATGAPESHTDVYLQLGTVTTENFGMGSDVVRMQAFTVQGAKDLVFDSGKMSSGSEFNSEQIADLPTVRRNVQDIAQLDSRLVLQSLSGGGELSAQGQNLRFNSFLVDNVQANDPFGLNANGYSSLRSPIPLEAIQALSIELNPYDVRRSGFTGALINAVTKSGTNKFQGESYVEYTDQYMRAKNPNTQAREVFHERVYGGTLGGPIIKNRLFFFVDLENFRRNSPPPTQNFVIDATQVGQIVARAKTFNYDPGTFSGAASISIQKTRLYKVDWNINEQHRASVTYRNVKGFEPSFPNFTNSTGTSFSQYWFSQPRNTETITAQLFSNWTSNFRTEATFSRNNYYASPVNNGPAFPEVFIRGLTGTRVDNGLTITTGTVDLGTEFSRQFNQLYVKTTNAALSGEYSFGAHTLLVGGDYQRAKQVDAFIQAWYGTYTFNTLTDWLNGTPASVQQAILAPGKTTGDAIIDYPYTMYGLFVQDIWKPSSRLTLSLGLRLDDPYVNQAPTPIPTTTNYSEAQFQTAFGRRSDTTNNGNYTVGPRLGFIYDFDTDRKTQIRGGIGLFQGSNPAVWIGNPYQNRGVTARVTTNNPTFSPNVTSSFGAFPSTAVAVVNVTDPNMRSPVSWKSNLAVDHKLPFLDLVASVEVDFIKADEALMVQDLNLKPVGTNPDGRIRYAGNISATTAGTSRTSASASYGNNTLYQNAGFADVFLLRNTKKGGGNDFTLKLARPFKNNWSAGIAVTHSNYKEVSPMTSSVAQSNYNTRAVFNTNEDTASVSNSNVPYRVVAQATRRFYFMRNAPTTISAIYQGHSGRPYSWVFFGDANGDGFTFNDLLYVPTGPNDPKVRWNSTTERDNFFAWAQTTTLMKYAGRAVPRNSEVSPWTQTVDLKLTQEIPIWHRLHTELFVNCLDFANLLNRRWGLTREVPFSYRRSVAGTTYDATANQYVYTFTPATLDPVPTTADSSPTSRWQVQVGARLKF